MRYMLDLSYNTLVTRIRYALNTQFLLQQKFESFKIVDQISPAQDNRAHHVSHELVLILRGEVEVFSKSIPPRNATSLAHPLTEHTAPQIASSALSSPPCPFRCATRFDSTRWSRRPQE